MSDREKIIKGLEYCAASCKGAWDENNGCPYLSDFITLGPNHNGRCVDLLCVDTLALLKEQEPRVMTWQEAQARVASGPFINFEVRDSTGSEMDYGVLVGDYYEMSEGSVLTVDEFGLLEPDYGKRFRVWTSRPTEEQREATPWG